MTFGVRLEIAERTADGSRNVRRVIDRRAPDAARFEDFVGREPFCPVIPSSAKSGRWGRLDIEGHVATAHRSQSATATRVRPFPTIYGHRDWRASTCFCVMPPATLRRSKHDFQCSETLRNRRVVTSTPSGGGKRQRLATDGVNHRRAGRRGEKRHPVPTREIERRKGWGGRWCRRGRVGRRRRRGPRCSREREAMVVARTEHRHGDGEHRKVGKHRTDAQ